MCHCATMKVLVFFCLLATAVAFQYQDYSSIAVGGDHDLGYAHGASDCPLGWKTLGDNRCITSPNEKRSYSEAAQYCSYLGDDVSNARLLRLQPGDQLALKLQSLFHSSELYYVGVTWNKQTNKYYGPDGSDVNANSLTVEPPTTYGDNVSCLVLNGNTYSGMLVDCRYSHYFICERDQYSSCTDALKKSCVANHGMHSECVRESRFSQSILGCNCKTGYIMDTFGRCTADRVFELPPDHVNCTDSTGRNLLIFNSANYAKTKVAFQKAKDNCREYGAEILTRQQALLSCITNHRLGHEQYLHRDGEISTHNLSPVWVQDHRDYCTSLGVDGIPKTVSCEKPTHFLCAKPLTNSYQCEAADKLLSYIMPADLLDAQSQCQFGNAGKSTFRTTLVSAQDILAFPELLPCMQAALSTVQPDVFFRKPASKVYLSGEHGCEIHDFGSRYRCNCTSDAEFGAVAFCIRDSPKTFIDITTNLEFFHPVGDARYGRTDFQGASRACQVAGGSLASQSNLLLLQDAARLLMHFIPTPLERDFPHAGRYLWQGSATDRCYISYIGGATQHQLHDSCVASNLYLCQKDIPLGKLFACGQHNYTHPGDITSTRTTYSLAKKSCENIGAHLPMASDIIGNTAESGCMQMAASASGLQNPVPFAKPFLEELELWLGGPKGLNQSIFNTANPTIMSSARRTSAQRYVCVYPKPVKPLTTTPPAAVPTASPKITCQTGQELLAGADACTDINECESQPCLPGAICNNLKATFNCSCPTGLRPNNTLADKSTHCVNIDECTSKTYCLNEGETCVDSYGSFHCGCIPGYTRNITVKKCVNINECAAPTSPCLPGNRLCRDTQGSFNCGCPAGYELNGTNSGYCVNKDECKQSDICQNNSVCQDTIGSYQCRCKTGYSNTTGGCRNVNECNDPICHMHATCNDTQGSFLCTCNDGYSGNGYVCSNIDECNATDSAIMDLVNATCGNTSQCVDTVGSFACPCLANYSGDIFCPTMEREVDNIVEAQTKPSTFSDPLVLSGIVGGGVLVILAIVIVIGVGRNRSAKRATAEAHAQGRVGVQRSTTATSFNT